MSEELGSDIDQQKEVGVTSTTINNTRVDDASLIKLLLVNSSEALNELYERYYRLVYRVVLNSISDPDVADEIVQDVFTRAWKKAGTYDAGIAKVSTWLVGITRHRVIDELRRGRARHENTNISWTEMSESASLYSEGPEEDVEFSWQRWSLKEALDTLPLNQRDALTLAFFGGYSQDKTAEILGIPLGTAKTRIRSGIHKLRQVLSQSMLDYM